MNTERRSCGARIPGRFPGSAFGLALVAAVAGTGVACGVSPPPGSETLFTDSPGVAIAESSTFPEEGAGGWSLDPTPSLSIGTLDGGSIYQCFQVTGSLRLPDGRLAISDLGTRQLRIYSADGTYQTSFGREGEGPGEFRDIRVMGTVGSDTLVVLDGALRRVSRIHPEAGFLGVANFPEEAGITRHFNGMFSDGSIVFGGGVNWNRGEADEVLQGYERLTNPFVSVALDGEGITHFGEFPGTEVVWTMGNYGGRESVAAGFPHFGKSPRAMARGNQLVLGTRDRYEVLVFDPLGEMVRIVRVDAPPVPVTQAHLEALLEQRLSRLPDSDLAPRVREGFWTQPRSDYLPAFEALLIDSEGCIWVEDYLQPGAHSRTWTIFSTEGRPLTRLSLPVANRVFDIGEDYILASFQDELDVEYVRMYLLKRGAMRPD